MASPEEFPEKYDTGSLGPAGREPNPFASEHSGYGHFVDGKFESVYPQGSEMYAFHHDSHEYVQDYVLGKRLLLDRIRFPCVFGEAVFRTRQYSFSAYDNITDVPTAEGLLHDIIQAQHELEIPAVPPRAKRIYRATLASFRKPEIDNELHGAEVLYTLIRNLHELNSRHYTWISEFSNDPASNDFALSLGESVHFIAYFHPHAAVPARRTEIPFMVINSIHVLNESMQRHGTEHHNRTRDTIRERQEFVHPAFMDDSDLPFFALFALVTADPKTQAANRRIMERILGNTCPFGSPEIP